MAKKKITGRVNGEVYGPPRPEFGPAAKKVKLQGNAGAGRKWGAVNKITRDLKQGIVDAAILHGMDGRGKGGLTGYLFFLAKDHPKHFAGLLGRLMPLQISADAPMVLGPLRVVPVPSDRYLSADQIKLLQPPAQPVELMPLTDVIDVITSTEEAA